MTNLRGILGQLPYATQVLSRVAPDAAPTRLDEAASRALRRVQLSALAQGAEVPGLEATVLAARTLLETAGLDPGLARDQLARHPLHARYLGLVGTHDTLQTTARNHRRAFEVIAQQSWKGIPGGWKTESCFQETVALARGLSGRSPRSKVGPARFLRVDLEIGARISSSGRQHLQAIGHLLPGIRLSELDPAYQAAYDWMVAQGGSGAAQDFQSERALRDAREVALQTEHALRRAEGRAPGRRALEFPRATAIRGFDRAQVQHVVSHRWGVTANPLKMLAALPRDLTYDTLKKDPLTHGHYQRFAEYTWADLEGSWRTTEALQQALAMIREAL